MYPSSPTSSSTAAVLQPAESKGENGKISCFPAAPASLLQPAGVGGRELRRWGTGACEETVCLARGLLDELPRKDCRTETAGGERAGGKERGGGGGGQRALKFALRSVGSSGKLDKAPRPSSARGEPTRRWHRLQSSLGWKSMALCPLLPALDLAPYLKAALILSFYFRVGFFFFPRSSPSSSSLFQGFFSLIFFFFFTI